MAAQHDLLDATIRKPARREVRPYDRQVTVAARCPLHEPRRPMRMPATQTTEKCCDDRVLVNAIPYVEHKMSPLPQDPTSFPDCCWLIWKEHDPELAHDHIEAAIIKGQVQGISLTEVDPTKASYWRDLAWAGSDR